MLSLEAGALACPAERTACCSGIVAVRFEEACAAGAEGGDGLVGGQHAGELERDDAVIERPQRRGELGRVCSDEPVRVASASGRCQSDVPGDASKTNAHTCARFAGIKWVVELMRATR